MYFRESVIWHGRLGKDTMNLLVDYAPPPLPLKILKTIKKEENWQLTQKNQCPE